MRIEERLEDVGDRLDESGARLMRRVRILIWNGILGLLLFFFLNEVFGLGIPYASWPLAVAAVFGVPGALAAVILWVLLV